MSPRGYARACQEVGEDAPELREVHEHPMRRGVASVSGEGA